MFIYFWLDIQKQERLQRTLEAKRKEDEARRRIPNVKRVRAITTPRN